MKALTISLLITGLLPFQLHAAYTAMANAKMLSKNGSSVTGTFDFKGTPQGLEIKYDLAGLPKNQLVGVHIHEKGDCSSADAKSAGGHYHKVEATGGTSLDFPGKYAGDLPSIKVDEKGSAAGTFLVTNLAIFSDPAIKDRAIIIHGGPDDLNKKSAPRIACGKIEVQTKTE